VDQVSIAARRRWFAAPGDLPERQSYRPPTLHGVENALGRLPAADYAALPPPAEGYVVHEVQPRESLSAIAVRYYNEAAAWPEIYAANRYKIDDPAKIYVGQVLRIPLR
jgi:nucleoid-associated protein YgaU